MKIYEIDSDVEHYQSFRFLNDEDYQIAKDNCNKGLFVKEWTTLTIEPENSDVKPFIGDYPYLLSIPLISSSAKKVFQDYINCSQIQFLEVYDRNSSKYFYFLNVIESMHAINKKETEFKYFESDLVGVKSLILQENINYPSFFKVFLNDTFLLPRRLFITEATKDLIVSHNLEGFIFKDIPLA